MVILFENVGRGKRTFEIEAPGEWTPRTLNVDKLAKLARKVRAAGGLMSRDVDFTYDDTTRTGTVLVGGFRPVGTFRVRPDP